MCVLLLAMGEGRRGAEVGKRRARRWQVHAHTH